MKKYYFLQRVVRQFLVIATILFSGLHYAKANEINVSAAISLSNAFKEIAALYEAKHPMDKILFNFGASGSLLQQIDQGAPTDIFASADEETMDQAVKKGLIIENSRKDFTNNSLVLIAPIHSNLDIHNAGNLLQPTVQKIAVGQPKIVPAGRYTQKFLQQNQLWDKLQNKLIIGQNVRQVLDYVARDEVNVGFVYHSDATILSNKVKILLDFPLSHSIRYPIALVKQKTENTKAQGFIDFILSSTGQNILNKYGFTSVSR
ncbi:MULTISPECIES: molybdate ABC transporter substrate-binding protein [Commensalibacter]|uniref:Molybdate ABC transporter periplasmic molybdate-binding protein n=2 Tax=Commensalibacter TaxID=1079922 RepID=W7DYN8_9PROT|nr:MULTISPECIES: molybdate ABC transporter substrate-binding protein [Commensalibacter]EUK17809.1 molybdate ABC transporter periplasmic molybdate-binding protein [Commensalibacter papalotli (ex Servin-Garciduenas et al. 2014)]CAI3943714.1 ABC-type molybdate transport system [Commensalibacter papalotli (ex Botero et al. 2024)]CAI3947178.1 ABC-type molybdate transport system [Commensalibacter papalotli (ex Botero et al. 2024)]